MRIEINGAELCVDTFGDPADPAVLLIMGGAGSMDRWEEPFCERLAGEIPAAELLVIDGLGHEFPPSAWDEVLPALIARTGTA